MTARSLLTTCLGFFVPLLFPLLVLAQGDIQITTEEGVIINLDDDIKGRTTAREGGMYIADVSSGRHKIKAEKSGAGTLEATVMVQEGRTTEVCMRFAPPPLEVSDLVEKEEVASTQGLGILVLRSVPLHASVFLDGKEMGTTDMEIRCVPAGEHTIKLVYKDYGVLEGSYRLAAGETLRLKGHFSENGIVNESEVQDSNALSKKINRFLHTPILKGVQERIQKEEEGT